MKCDEVQPTCGQCARRGLTCAYDEFVRRRGPSKKKKMDDPNNPMQQLVLAAPQIPPPPPPPGIDGHPKYILMDPHPDIRKQSDGMDAAGPPPPVIWS